MLVEIHHWVQHETPLGPKAWTALARRCPFSPSPVIHPMGDGMSVFFLFHVLFIFGCGFVKIHPSKISTKKGRKKSITGCTMSYTIVRYHTETALKCHESKVPVQAFYLGSRPSKAMQRFTSCLETEWNLASASILSWIHNIETSNSISSSEAPQGLRSEARRANEGQRPTDVKKKVGVVALHCTIASAKNHVYTCICICIYIYINIMHKFTRYIYIHPW